VVVSNRIRQEFENGKDYYRLQGERIREPGNVAFRPLTENLEYHAYNRFR
jgi:putative restriction endonuclease